MNNTYLSDEQIKSLKTYLSILTPEIINTINELSGKMNYELYYETEGNKIAFTEYITRKLENDLSEDGQIFRKRYDSAFFQKAQDIFNNFIRKYHNREYQIIFKEFNPTEIRSYLNGVCGFCSRNFIEAIEIKDIFKAGNIDEYLKRYSIKNVDEKLIKRTDNIIKYLDSVYFGEHNSESYELYQYAIREYLTTGNKQNFHNMLNKTR